MVEEEKKLSLAETIRRKIQSGEVGESPKRPDLLDGRYKLLAQIGEDQTTLSFKAVLEVFGRFVKVRILKPELCDDEQAIKGLLIEGSNAARVETTPEGRLHDMSCDPSRLPFIVYLRDPLFERLVGSPISPEQEHRLLNCVRTNPPAAPELPDRPMTAEERNAIEQLKKAAMDIAEEMRDQMRQRSLLNRENLGRALSTLEHQGLRTAWRDCIDIFVSSGSFGEESWMPSHVNQILENVVSQFGEEPVRKYLIENFTQWADRIEHKTRYKNVHSNKELAVAFQLALSCDRPDRYMSAEERAKWIKDIEDSIEQK